MTWIDLLFFFVGYIVGVVLAVVVLSHLFKKHM